MFFNLPPSKVHPIIKRLLRENEEVFETPTKLPPKRTIDHQIVMEEG